MFQYQYTITQILKHQRPKSDIMSLQLNLIVIKKSGCDSLLLNDRPVLPTRLSFWMKKIRILFQNWAPCAYQAERLPKCFMNHEIMNIIAILLLNNNIISLDNGLHYVVVYGLHSNLLVNRRLLSSALMSTLRVVNIKTDFKIYFFSLEHEPTTAEIICRNNLQRVEEGNRNYD